MAAGLLALDVDGTITTANPNELQRLLALASQYSTPCYINTARPKAYCEDPASLTTKIAPRENHLCQQPGSDSVPSSKVSNMLHAQSTSHVDDAKCCVLVDDRPENIRAVRAHGFTGIQVDPMTGIQKDTVDEVSKVMSACARRRGQTTLLQRCAIIVVIAVGFIAIAQMCLKKR